MATTKLDFSTCPHCGATDRFRVSSDERIYGSAAIGIHLGDGETDAYFLGETEISWDSSTTVGYSAECCGQSLPDDFQDELDRLLEIDRESQ